MISVALIVAIITFVRVVVESNSANLVTDCNNWLVWNFNDVEDAIISTVLFPDLFEVRICSETFSEPFKIKVNVSEVYFISC